jgi:hypothetical protein
VIADGQHVQPLIVPVAEWERHTSVSSRGQVAEALRRTHHRKQGKASVAERIRIQGVRVHPVVRMVQVARAEASSA